VPAVPSIVLNNGVPMPRLGFGTFDLETPGIVTALKAGYRNLDTAAAYGNEAEVGRAIAEAADAGVDRGDVFVTTKVWNRDQGYDRTRKAFDASLERLGLDYVDLYLIHWPAPRRGLYVETWRALEGLYKDGRVRAIGVSNFTPEHLTRLMDEASLVPAVNQVELHPWHAQRGLREFHAAHRIATVAWSPLAQGRRLMSAPVVSALAAKHGRTGAQVVLRWHLQSAVVAIPRSATPSRVTENIDILGFQLTDRDMAALDALDSGARIGPDPSIFG
jgi:diketogulonate reductase-like aldo/keto reductase